MFICQYGNAPSTRQSKVINNKCEVNKKIDPNNRL